MYERVAAIDVGKKEVAVTVRVPGQSRGARTQQTRKFRTFYPALRQMVSWLIEQGVTQVAMEATGVFWKPVFHAVCEPDTLEVVLVNARHVKNVPGRKSDPLTELPCRCVGRDVRGRAGLAGFPRCDQRRGSAAAGVVRAGGAAVRVG